MSRGELEDRDALAIADVIDWWVPCVPGPILMRSLREAVRWALAQPERGRITLFRPPGGAGQSVWVSAAQVKRLAVLFDSEEAPCREDPAMASLGAASFAAAPH